MDTKYLCQCFAENLAGIVTQLLSVCFCPIFQPSVDIKTVLSQLMERLSNYAASSAEVLPEFLQVEAFSKLSNAIGKVFYFLQQILDLLSMLLAA